MIGSTNECKISVIVPVYNAEKYLDRCIQSVLQQTYPNWELILIDDGSKDESGSIADQYEQTDDRIRVIHQQNAGVSAARNQGLNLATGDYVAFLDADDELTSDCFNKLLRVAIENHADIVAGKCSSDRNSTRQLGETIIWHGEEALKNALMDNPFTYSAWAKLFHMACIGNTRFVPEIKINEDSYFIFQLLTKKPTFVGIEDDVYLYRENPDSASRAAFSEKFFDVLRVADLKHEIIKNRFPTMLTLANNMQLKARMNLLHLLAVRTATEYHDLEKEMLAWVRKNRDYYISATKDDDKWMWILSHHLYFSYKWVKHKK